MIKLFFNNNNSLETEKELVHVLTVFPDKTKSLSFMKENLKEIKKSITEKSSIIYELLYDDGSVESEDILFLSYIKSYIKEVFPRINYHILIMPYIPNARNDRKQDEFDFFTLKYFADYINSLGFNEVRVIDPDPHSDVSKGLLNNCKFEDMSLILDQLIDSYDTLAFPDMGSYKKYSNFLDKKLAGKNLLVGFKNRDFSTGKINSVQIIPVLEKKMINESSRILIIDDICSYGGTFYFFIKALLDLYSIDMNNIDLYVTYLESAFLKGDLYKQKLIKNCFFKYKLFKDDCESYKNLYKIQLIK